ncbi:MAG: acyloxyacyl hydrolase, partial [Nitrospiraceae bacterium]
LLLGASLLPAGPCGAEDIRLDALGVRAGTNQGTVKRGADLERYELYANLGLPWSWEVVSNWNLGTRLNASGGALTGEGETGFIGTLGPSVTLGRERGRIILDIGVGIALLSNDTFGTHDFGGPFQFTADIGITALLLRHVGVGYRFQHMSDATIYGSDGRGMDSHILELSYRF